MEEWNKGIRMKKREWIKTERKEMMKIKKKIRRKSEKIREYINKMGRE